MMKRLLLAGLVAAFLICLAAEAQLPPTNAVCKSDDPGVRKDAMAAALIDLYKPTLSVTDFSKSPAASLAELIGESACKDQGPACEQRKRLADEIYQLTKDRGNAVYRLEWSVAAKTKEPDPSDITGRFEAFFDTSKPNYTITCKGTTPDPDWPPVKLPELIIAATPSDLSKPTDKRTDAKLAVTLDRENKIELTDNDGAPVLDSEGKQVLVPNEDFKFTGLVALKAITLKSRLIKRENQKEENRVILSVQPFVSLGYDNNIKPNKETDDLGFGASFKWEPESWYEPVYFTPQWITDIEQRESSQFVVEAKSALPLFDLIEPLSATGYSADVLVGGKGSPLKFYWTLDAVADFGDIQDAGDKTELEIVERYTRIGYDLFGQLSLKGNESSGQWALSGKYKFRDDFDSGKAKMDLVDITASYTPPGKSNFSFEISYDQGENLTSLKPIETWTVGLGFHN